MATFRIHEDQENRGREQRNKPSISVPVLFQKRAVLGTLDNNLLDRNNKAKQPQPLGASNNADGSGQGCSKAPVVPVAQFQAFKVYEESREEVIKRTIDRYQNMCAKEILKDVYTGADREKRMITKKEALEKAGFYSRPPPPIVEIVLDSPMSVEKSPEAASPEPAVFPPCSRGNKDLFFEMPEYREDIYQHLIKQEKLHRPKPNYMKKQPDINHNMRTILVDWLVEVAEEYKLHTETLYLAVSYIDRFLSYMSVVRAKLQLVGTAAMFIAAKYEEIYPPEVSEFVYITDDTYSKRQVIRMEMLILKVLDFDLSLPTAYTFITAMSICNNIPDKMIFLAQFISELALLEAEPTLEILPAVMAASAIVVSRHTLGEKPWDDQLEKSTGYCLADLRQCIEYLASLHKRAAGLPQQAIQQKYKAGKFLHVASIEPSDEDITFD